VHVDEIIDTKQRTFSPLGSHEKVRFQGRVIAATHRLLAALRRPGASAGMCIDSEYESDLFCRSMAIRWGVGFEMKYILGALIFLALAGYGRGHLETRIRRG